MTIRAGQIRNADEVPRGSRNTETRDVRLAALSAESVPALIRRLADDVTDLFVQQVALLKSEMKMAIGQLKSGAVRVAGGGALTFLRAWFVLLAIVYGLSEVVAAWLAALIVGSVVMVIGVVMLVAGKNRLEPAKLQPRRTATELRKDRDAIKEALSS